MHRMVGSVGCGDDVAINGVDKVYDLLLLTIGARCTDRVMHEDQQVWLPTHVR
jgi:hypothetical protein